MRAGDRSHVVYAGIGDIAFQPQRKSRLVAKQQPLAQFRFVAAYDVQPFRSGSAYCVRDTKQAETPLSAVDFLNAALKHDAVREREHVRVSRGQRYIRVDNIAGQSRVIPSELDQRREAAHDRQGMRYGVIRSGILHRHHPAGSAHLLAGMRFQRLAVAPHIRRHAEKPHEERRCAQFFTPHDEAGGSKHGSACKQYRPQYVVAERPRKAARSIAYPQPDCREVKFLFDFFVHNKSGGEDACAPFHP
ncbi:unknown [Eubacterium sp. CAG:786]|nr:unknown [Eubacterium sp. CAG:786]